MSSDGNGGSQDGGASPGGLQKIEGTVRATEVERRYDDDEIGEIFAKATETQAGAPLSKIPSDGLTLGQLQEIGREVGVDPAHISRAAAALGVRPAVHPRRRYMGFPVGVARTAELQGTLTDRDWERLVVELRETFDAKGSVRREGSLRQWTNGNLQALVEPTETGERLRLRTTSSRLQAMLRLGSGGLTLGLVFLMMAAFSDTFALSEIGVAMAALFGVGIWGLGTGAVLSFPWAREREMQMEAIAERAAELAGGQERPAIPSSVTDDSPTEGVDRPDSRRAPSDADGSQP